MKPHEIRGSISKSGGVPSREPNAKFSLFYHKNCCKDGPMSTTELTGPGISNVPSKRDVGHSGH